MTAPAWFTDNCAVTPTRGSTVVEGCAISWLRWGHPAAAPLVLVHGGGASAQWWVPLAPFWAEQWCVIAVDLSGMGESGWRPSGYRTEVWADEVLAVAAAASTSRRAPVLAGHSLGGTVVAVAAARRPASVRGVVLCDSGVGRSRSLGRSGRHFQNRFTYPSAEEALRRFKLIPRQECANDWMVEHLARTSLRPVGPGGPDDPTRPPPGQEQAWAWKFDWRLFARTYDQPYADYLAELGRSGVPVALINGEHSRLVDDEVTERLRALLGAVPTVRIPEAQHHLMADQPLAFVTALRAVLTGM